MSIAPQENELLHPAEPAEVAEQGAPSEPATTSKSATRRQLFTLGAAMAAATLAPLGKASAQRVVRPPVRRPPEPAVGGDALLMLVRRITNGITEEEVARAKSLGFRKYLDYHLKPSAIKDSVVETFVASNYPALTQDGLGLYQQDVGLLLRQLQESTLYRAAFSKRQLYEHMVEFWSDHFNIYYPKVQYLKLLDERDVIRKHALGTFSDLLRASAHSPAMLEYLDNTRSRGRNVNQNYARELMELHTLGVDGGYTQTDVEEVTRCLTGWTIQGRGLFRFDPAGHDFTAKMVLGNAIAGMATSAGAAAISDGETVLNILLAHPSTARFIATKMSRWLLQYDPPSEVVDEVAGVFEETKGDIPSMIRAILTPANLLAASAKYKQPYQLVLSALRVAQPTVRSLTGMSRQLPLLGQQLFYWEEPDGYPDEVDWWAGSILQRWNFCSFLTGLTTGDVVVDVAGLMPDITPDAVTTAIGKRVFAGQMPSPLYQRIKEYLAAAPVTTTRVREAFALALSSTDFQWY